MSDSLMPFQPAMEEPSNILPSVKKSSVTNRAGTLTCCSFPRVSVKRRSANFTCFSLIRLNTSAGVMLGLLGEQIGDAMAGRIGAGGFRQ